jgi:hypothetical protein
MGLLYVVALTADAKPGGLTPETYPISADAVEVLLKAQPELRLDGERPEFF